MDLETSGEIIEVMFQTEVFKVGTVFAGRIYDSKRPVEVRQRVTAGDADPLVEGNTLSVNPAVEGTRTIRSFEVSPFTPNADGINDHLTVEYDLVNLAGGAPVSLEVFDLAGVRVWRVLRSMPGRAAVLPRPGTAGTNTPDCCPPGLYLLRLEIEADEKPDADVAALALVF